MAACNLGDDAPKFTQIRFGRISLSGFAEGSFALSNQAGLGDADQWNFKLAPANNELEIQISGSANSTVAGRLTLAKPITGHVLERHAAGYCERTIQFDDGTFAQSQLHVANLLASNSFGGKFSVTGVTVAVLDNDSLSDSKTGAKGSLVLSTQSSAIEGASITFPSSNDTVVATSLTQTSASLSVEISASNLAAAIVDGTLDSRPIKIAPAGGLTVAAAGLQAEASAVSAKTVQVEFLGRKPRVSFQSVVIGARRGSLLPVARHRLCDHAI